MSPPSFSAGADPDRVTLAEMQARIPAEGIRSARAFLHGTMEGKLYQPRGVDLQQPHTRDEVYVVAGGNARFVNGEAGYPVAAGDFLFVPAGRVHRFEEISEDFTVWVVFYGPEGGEQP